jgi:hypothetical protein
MIRLSSLLAFTLLAPVAPVIAQEAIPVPVHVTWKETPVPPPLKAEQHQAAITAAENNYWSTLDAMFKQHGKKQDTWPPAATSTVDDLHDAWGLAQARMYYQSRNTQLSLDDSVADFLRGAEKNKKMTMVSSVDDAALLVVLTGRRYSPGKDITDNSYFIRFRLMAGPKMTHERFLEYADGHKWYSVYSTLFARAKDPAPDYLDLEAGSMASYKNCAAAVRAIVETFVWQQMDPSYKKKDKK